MHYDPYALKKTYASRVWDLDVPIVLRDGITYVYLTSEIEEPSLYNELFHTLVTANDNQTVHIVINTLGGVVSSGLMIAEAIKQSKAWVVCELVGDVCSIGTIITMACDELRAANNLSFMIHNYSGGLVGKGHEMKTRQNFVEGNIKDTFYEYYKGFLTEAEIGKVLEDTDMWFGTQEVLDRWQNKLQNEGKLDGSGLKYPT